MSSKKLLVATLAAVGFGLATAATLGANVETEHTMYVTFNRPVSLPGVTLGSGTYIFETPSDNAHSLVRVLSRDRSMVYLTTFTNAIDRPAGLNPDQPVSFAETAANRPLSIAVWWPQGIQGRQFIYPKQ